MTPTQLESADNFPELDELESPYLFVEYYKDNVGECNAALLTVLDEEESGAIPVITETDFGHICPVFTIPYEVMAHVWLVLS